MDWKHYEQTVFDILRTHFPNANVIKDAKLRGRHSKRMRQIDIFVEEVVGGNSIKIVVDCANSWVTQCSANDTVSEG